MLDGWYCRSMANMQANDAGNTNSNDNSEPTVRPKEGEDEYSSDSSSEGVPEPNYKAQYISLKKKLKYLIYENECFQDALRSSQKRLLRVSRDRSFLLDRLLQYEKPESSTSESDDTESSDDNQYPQVAENPKRRKTENNPSNHNSSGAATSNKTPNAVKRKRAVVPKKSNVGFAQLGASSKSLPSSLGFNLSNVGDGHMTPEEVERHLQSRNSYLGLLPERAPPTVPTEMFSNDPSLDSESNDVLENSPNVEEWFE